MSATTAFPARTLCDALILCPKNRTLATDAALVVGASVLVALSAQVSIQLPFTPVPITGQTFGVLLIGALLGSRRGALALLLYLLEGAIGLPFFAGGGGGLLKLLGPTAGYLWSYPLVAALVGFLAERGWDRRPLGAIAAMFLGDALILTMGVAWLSHFVPGGLPSAWAAGAAPFLPGDAAKLLLATALLPGAWALARRMKARDGGETSTTENRPYDQYSP